MPQPQPGAQKGTTHLPYAPLTASSFPQWAQTLNSADAINFNDATPQKLAPGTTLWRVYGGAAYNTGSYWSPSPLSPQETESHWRSSEAVAFSWNSGTKLCSMTVGSNGMYGWAGSVSEQAAQDTGGMYLPGYVLEGMGQQVKIMYPPGANHQTSMPGYYDIVNSGPTPWAGGLNAVKLSLNKGPTGALSSTRYAGFSQALSNLSNSLQSQLGKYSGLEDVDEAHAYMAKIIDSQHGDLEKAVLDDDISTPQRVAVLLRSFRGLNRHLVLDHDPEAEQALKRVTDMANESL